MENLYFMGYIRVSTAKNKTDQNLLGLQKTEIKNFFERFKIPFSSYDIIIDIGSADEGVGQSKLMHYLEQSFQYSQKKISTIIVYSLDRFCRSTCLLAGLQQYLFELNCSLLCLKEKICYFASFSLINWEEYGFFNQPEGVLTKNVWLNEMEIKDKKERYELASSKIKSIGINFRSIPYGMKSLGDFLIPQGEVNQEQYKIVQMMNFMADDHPELEIMLTFFDASQFDTPIDLNLLRSKLEIDANGKIFWDEYKIAKFLNFLGIKDENKDNFTHVKVRNILFYWSTLKCITQ